MLFFKALSKEPALSACATAAEERQAANVPLVCLFFFPQISSWACNQSRQKQKDRLAAKPCPEPTPSGLGVLLPSSRCAVLAAGAFFKNQGAGLVDFSITSGGSEMEAGTAETVGTAGSHPAHSCHPAPAPPSFPPQPGGEHCGGRTGVRHRCGALELTQFPQGLLKRSRSPSTRLLRGGFSWACKRQLQVGIS